MAKAKKTIASESIESINKHFGAGSIMVLGDNDSMDISCIPTGSLSIDAILGGGIPRGRVIEIFAPESAGKTTFVLGICAQAQKEGEIIAFIDAEHALDPGWALKIGLDLKSCLICQPNSAEDALGTVEMLIDHGEVGLIVVDSVAALAPRLELEGAMGDAHVGLLARLMGQAMRKLTAKLNTSKTTVIFINQIREKIGVVGYGSPETQPGGRALKFAASQRIDLRRIGAIKDGEEVVGHQLRVKVIKNKIAPPLQECTVGLYYDRGICPFAELLDLGISTKHIIQKGSWIGFGDENIGQGRQKARLAMMDNPELVAKIRAKVIGEEASE